MYGFRKETKEKKTKQEEYKHEFFKRGKPELLEKITRKKKTDDDEVRGKYMDESREGSDILFPSSHFPLQLGAELNTEDLKYINPEIIKDVDLNHRARRDDETNKEFDEELQ